MKGFASILVFVLASAMLWLSPEVRKVADDGIDSVRAEVLEVDDSGVETHGLVAFGTERLKVRLPDGRIFAAENELRAQADLDKRFAVGDIAIVNLPRRASTETILIARDHWRMGWGIALFALFSALLWLFGGLTGLKALLSFVFSCLAVWKLLIPLALAGYSSSLVIFATVVVLTGVIMGAVAGLNRKGLVAFLGAILGVVASLGLAALFTRLMHVTGYTMPYAMTLLYAGYSSLDLGDIFIGSIVLASSGAVMDLAMDIAAGQSELVRHTPEISGASLYASGLRMGRAVVGTMTTTLLLAYSGGYLTLLMMFAAQGTPPLDFLNSTLVSAELVKTLVGSFGLVLVAPFTALVGAICLPRSS